MGYIYKITNCINDLIFIGKTEESIEQKWKIHNWEYNKGYKKYPLLYKAMQEFGIENFKIEKIEEIPNELLSQKERDYIAIYNSYEKGYNATKGGRGINRSNKKQIISCYQKTENVEIVHKETGASHKTIRKILHEANIEIKDNKSVLTRHYGVNINMLDKNTKAIIKTFKSLAEAYNYLFEKKLTTASVSGIRHHIKACAEGQRKTAYGYAWAYASI